jgi:ABC-type transport system involved in multi-copper enzyme maturation permease subunit
MAPGWLWWVIGGLAAVGLVAVVGWLVRRWGFHPLGPLYWHELRRLARRGTHLRLRVGLAFLLLVGLLETYRRTFPSTDLLALLFGGAGSAEQSELSGFGETFLIAFLIVTQAAVLLITPVYAGGAIADEKERGGLDFLLTTPLSRWELVAGKLAARLTFVLGVVAVGVPVLFLTLLFGGVDVGRVLAAFAVIGATVLSVGCFAVMLSVLRHTLRDVLLWCYGTLAVVVVFGFCLGSCLPRVGAVSPVGVVWALVAEWRNDWSPLTDRTWAIIGLYAAVHLGLAGFFLLLAVNGVRRHLRDEPPESGTPPWVNREPAAEPGPDAGPPPMPVDPLPDWYRVPEREVFAGGEPPPDYIRGRNFVVPKLADEDDPLRWKERHFGGRLPLTEGRWASMAAGCGATAFLFVLCAGLFVGVAHEVSSQRWIDRPVNVVVRAFLVAAVLAVPVLGVRTAVSVTEERAKQTLVSLLTLPVPRGDVLRAKVRAAVYRTRWLLFGVGGALALGLLTGGLLPHAVAGAGVLLAGYAVFVAALGMWLSVRCVNSVRAVLYFVAVVLGTHVLPVLATPAVEILLQTVWGRTMWSDVPSLVSPAFGVWLSTGGSWSPAHRTTHAQSHLLNPCLVALVGVAYAAAGWVFWRRAGRRFEREGRN